MTLFKKKIEGGQLTIESDDSGGRLFVNIQTEDSKEQVEITEIIPIIIERTLMEIFKEAKVSIE